MKFLPFFKKAEVVPLKKKELSLISVHIPKTAGTSFRKTLKSNFGEKRVIRLDMMLKQQNLKVNEVPYEEDALPTDIEVVHGHFRPSDLIQRFPETERVPVITWLRDPVERVISNYYYLEKHLKAELNEAGRGLNILKIMQRSLLEYARADMARNRQSRFLKGMPLEDFKFVGILEHYSEDLAELGRRLDWDDVEEVRDNVTSSEKPVVSDEVRAEIARLNEEDIALYKHALHLRARRKETPGGLIPPVQKSLNGFNR